MSDLNGAEAGGGLKAALRRTQVDGLRLCLDRHRIHHERVAARVLPPPVG